MEKDRFLCRIRTKTIGGTLFQYVEYLCVFDEKNNEITLFTPTSNDLKIKTEFFELEIDTSESSKMTMTMKAKRDIVWLVSDDFTPKGGFYPENVPDTSVYFDTRISARDSLKMLRHKHKINELLQCTCDPLSLYHGSGADRKDSILLNGLRQSFGMLGDAVYLGTFFKATRYASRQQDYKLRDEGVIFRCLAFVKSSNIRQYPLLGYSCTCQNCINKNSGFERISDHFSQWNTGMFCGAEVLVSKEPFGYKKGGEPKFLSKNAEWAFRNNSVFVQEFLPLDISSIMGPHYHPLQRNSKCIW
jgi:hypothetical protein